jgi:Tfx family DNA-binding protein
MDTQANILTERQIEVLQLRERGLTQAAVAAKLGTTGSNVSAIERAAEANIKKAHRTLDFVRTLRAPEQFTVSAGSSIDDLVDEIYAHGNKSGIRLAYCRPELYAHLHSLLNEKSDECKIQKSVTIGLTEDGEVNVFTDAI